MTLHVGDKNIVDVRYGNAKIARIYKGGNLLYGYQPSEVLFESSTAGTYQLYVKCRCKLSFIAVGGGGGGSCNGTYYANNITANVGGGGGSGAYVYGTLEVFAGTYTITVGSAGSFGRGVNNVPPIRGSDGTSSVVFGQVAGGGGGSLGNSGGYGGSAGIAQTAYGFVNGNVGTLSPVYPAVGGYPLITAAGGASVYNGYGLGGNGDSTPATGGYVKITAV